MRNLVRHVEVLEERVLLSASIEYRSYDGSGNNVDHEQWGASNTQLLRLTTVEYGTGDGGDFAPMADRFDSNGQTINPRTVSNLLFDQDVSILNDRGLTSFVFQWGQFLDHDMDLTEDFAPVGVIELDGENITFFVPNDGTESELPLGSFIPQLRSRFELDENGIAQQINQITSYIDASNVYGSSEERADALRAGFGGFLLSSDGTTNVADGSGEFLPFNYEVDGHFIENASPPTTGTGVPISPDDLFVAGDVRANEQPGLTTLHTLFMREHNYQARRIADEMGFSASDLARPEVDEYVYQTARAIVSAEIQAITYNEFLPALFGPDQLKSYTGYQDDVNASIANVFSASLYRVGHTMLPSELLVLNPDGTPVDDDLDVLGAAVVNGEVSLSDAFFNVELVTQYGIEAYVMGLAEQQIQEIDNFLVDAVRNLLFDPPATTDLGATNLQRGRDHGLADYNQIRVDFGLEPLTSFDQISSDPFVVTALATAYDGDINNIDVFSGAVSEDHIAGGSVGELIHTVLVDQFTRLRDGDRFYYENVFHGKMLREIQNTQLSDIIRRNTGLTDVQDEMFRDESVFTFRAEETRRGVGVTLRVQGDQLQFVGKPNQILAAQNLADTDIVVFYGTSNNDRVMIDASVSAHFGGAIELHGGGGYDRLVMRGTALDNDVYIMSTEVRMDGMSVYYGNFEKLDIRTGGGDDFMIVTETIDMDVMLGGGRGNDIMVGAGGREFMMGGAGRDVMIGNAGSDTMFGNGGEDIVITGIADFDRTTLEQIRDVWAARLPQAVRMSMLQDDLLPIDDGVVDFVFGGFGRDWVLDDGWDFGF